ncbi:MULTISPECIES: TlpA family protein disulfide reductase [Methylomicrobium]|uniref:Thiol-disulfide isomerase-like thioredoxin n=1 Tax=Methylomicrobium album BG8 TaxID=686340 RepID=H8GJX3_METAL|nr:MULTISPECIES: TlpA disulfide reductase family protein [Methylomicrobium]EIC27932.1 thiol-disulfide isomerase-like thioredoxin [Methylomicrobium album BG8]
MKQAAIVIIIGLLALAGGIALRYSLYPAPEAEASPLPEFTLPDLSGQNRSVREWKDKILVINFWATWCPSCREEMPDLVALQTQYAAQGVQVIGVALEDKAPVEEYLDSVKINYPTLIAGEQGMALAGQLGNRAEAIPFTVVVDRQGMIRDRHLGKFSKPELAKIIDGLLE